MGPGEDYTPVVKKMVGLRLKARRAGLNQPSRAAGRLLVFVLVLGVFRLDGFGGRHRLDVAFRAFLGFPRLFPGGLCLPALGAQLFFLSLLETRSSSSCQVHLFLFVVIPACGLPPGLPARPRTGAFGFGPRLVNGDGPLSKQCAVQLRDRLLRRCVVRHLHEAKAAGPACVPVRDDTHPVYRPILLKKLADGFFSSVEIEVPDKDVFHSVPLR